MSILGELADQQRLRQAGHAHQEGVAAGEQADRHAVDGVALADDDAAQLGAQAGVHLPKLVDRLHVVLAEVHERFVFPEGRGRFHH
jgi:hypothetical protein